MPRIRSIHPDACDSEKLSSLSDSAERTFFRLLTHTDDEGRGEDRPKLLAAKLYPLHDDKDAGTVDADLDELQSIGLVVRYEVGGKRFYAIPTFTDWQNPRHPTASKLPGPEDADMPAEDDGASEAPSDSPTADEGNATADRRKAPAGVGGGVGGGEGVVAPPEASRKKPRPPDHHFDALMDACGLDPGELTASARGAANKALKELKDVGATPDGIRARAKVHRQKWPDMSLTPTSLARHYAQLGSKQGADDESVAALLGIRGYQ